MTTQYLCSKLDEKLELRPIREGRHVFYEPSAVVQGLTRWVRKRLPHKKTPRVYSSVERIERGRLAARVFSLLDEGKDFNACVQETEGDPEWVLEFYELYELGPAGVRLKQSGDKHEQWLADFREHNKETKLARERLEIRRLEAEADLIRAKRGEARTPKWATPPDKPEPPASSR